jgi:hypothetical protein
MLGTLENDRLMDSDIEPLLANMEKLLPPDSPVYQNLANVRRVMKTGWATKRSEFDDVSAAVPTVQPMLDILDIHASAADGAPATGATLGEAIAELVELAEQPGLSNGERASRLLGLGIAETESDEPPILFQAIQHTSEALRVAGPDDPRRPLYLLGHGFALACTWEATGDRRHLAPARRFLEEAQAASGPTAHVVWTMVAGLLAHVDRALGKRAHGREIALTGLRGHVWNVLLQSTVRRMHAAAEAVADDAISVAWWCLEDRKPSDAVLALETGRCLIVQSALETRDVDTRLRALGEDALADRWQLAVRKDGPDDAPTDLRRQVISALAGVPLAEDGTALAGPGDSTTHLLDPPSIDEIKAALTALHTDALVYLVAGDAGVGAAVVVPARGTPRWIRLPDLRIGSLTGFERALAGAARSAEPGDPGARDARRRVADSVPDVCAWAWHAAIGPLLADLGATSRRPIRLVLVPMGPLARVPWHAARHLFKGRPEYALERAVFSYTPSARLLCECANAGDVPLTGGGLVVGDPDTGGAAASLPAARAEALAINEKFYPDARYVGRTADGTTAKGGAGTAADVVSWLRDPGGGPMVHLACHSVAVRAENEPVSYFLLANGERLTAETLIRSTDRDIGLAVLASCRSAESVRGYDEAYSLATAFLVGRTRSVISAQWSVPDAPTSVLMFLFHHHLRVDGMRPAEALRAAQLWMLGDAPPPVPLPVELGARFDRRRVDLTMWAAFTHYGR